MTYNFLIFLNSFFVLIIFFFIYILSTKLEYFHFIYKDKKKIKNKNILISGGFFVFFSIIFLSLINNDNFDTNLIIIFTLFFILGFSDDFFNLSVKIRIILQFSIASFAYYLIFNDYNPILDFYFFTSLKSNYLSSIFIVFFIVLYVNAFNFIDGIDGLAGSHALFVILINTLIFSLITSYQLVNILFVLSLFVIINIQSSFLKKMYLGNSGSFFLGSYLVLLIIKSNLDHDFYHPFIILWICNYPLFNIGRVVILRLLERKNPFFPDKKHLHHSLDTITKSHFISTTIISIIYLVIFLIGFWSTLNFIPEINLLFFIFTFLIYFILSEYTVRKFKI